MTEIEAKTGSHIAAVSLRSRFNRDHPSRPMMAAHLGAYSARAGTNESQSASFSPSPAISLRHEPLFSEA